MAEFKDLIGKIITKIDKTNDEQLIFTLDNGDQYKMYHDQNCCESVSIDDICGDLDDLLLLPIIDAREDSNNDLTEEQKLEKERAELDNEYWYEPESQTWTFYNIATNKGHVTIKWFGTSNGYYSESVDFVKLGSDNDY